MKTITFLVIITIVAFCSHSAQSQIDYGSNQQACKYIDISDIKVYYETYGEGEPLLLFHGNGGSIHHFEFQIPELSKHFSNSPIGLFQNLEIL